MTLDREYLILSDDYVWEEDGKLHIEGGKETVIRCYPKPERFFGSSGWFRSVWSGSRVYPVSEKRKSGGYQGNRDRRNCWGGFPDLQPENNFTGNLAGYDTLSGLRRRQNRDFPGWRDAHRQLLHRRARYRSACATLISHKNCR